MKTKILLVFIILSSFALKVFPETLSLSFSGGFFFPRQKEFKDMYGDGNPYAFEIRTRVLKNFCLSSGLEYLKQQGHALGDGEEYPLEFKMTTIPFTIFYRHPLKKTFLSLGLGASYNSFEEKWETVEISFEDKKWGYFIFFSIEYRLVRRLSVLANLKYESLPTGKGSLLVKNVNLGGLKLFAGFSLCLF
jgi:hypothetical protein